MTTITPSDAVALVRKNLDEQDPNGSVMYDPDNAYGDNASLDLTIKKFLPEAINAVHLSAPVQLLEGKTVTAATPSISSDGVLSFSLPSGSKYLRMVAFQTKDSSIVVTDPLPEASAEGRKQLNKYVRGRYDRPRLVLLQGRHTEPAFKYYTLKNNGTAYSSNPGNAILQLYIIQEQFYASDATAYDISRRLRQNIVDCLTAMVMETYNDQRAQSYYQKANNFPTI
jgi:hypothetical protein